MSTTELLIFIFGFMAGATVAFVMFVSVMDKHDKQ